jgi:2-polyprenyl-3-methyl-5-hydroxy-6-metoxy-1,4-benzoquinol methylase
MTATVDFPAEETHDDVGIDIPAALRLYRDESAFMRAFTFGRHLLCPMRAVAEHVPPAGRILDVGCGHGLFTNLLALGSSRRSVLGIDPSDHKIDVAVRSGASLPNVRYKQCRVQDIDDGPYDAITILDVMYLLPDDMKMDMLRHCRKLLSPTGVLLLKTNDTRPRIKYAMVLSEEFLMVKLLGFTFGGKLHFRGGPEYLAMLKEAGFSADVFRIDRWHPAPHRLYLSRPV